MYRQHHVLGRDGHHELEEAVIYRAGARKGEVYARGVLRHTKGEHVDLDLGTIRWHLVVHNIQGASYTLSGGGTAANSTDLEPVIRLFRGQLSMNRIALNEFVPCRHMRTKGETKVESRAVHVAYAKRRKLDRLPYFYRLPAGCTARDNTSHTDGLAAI